MMDGKKGNLNLLTPGVVTIVLGSIILVFGLIILDELMNDTVTEKGIITQEAVTQTELALNTTLDRSVDCLFQGLSVSSCTNGTTSGIVIAPGNYTVGVNYIHNLTSTFSTASWYCNYTYKYGAAACTQGNLSIVGLAKFSDYIDLISLGVVITVILGVVILVFVIAGRRTQ